MASPTLAQYELFQAAETGDVATLERLFAQPATLETALAVEARITDEVLLRRNERAPLDAPPGVWMYLHDRHNHVFWVTITAHQCEIMKWLFTSPLSNRLLRTLQYFLEDAATLAILHHDVGILELLLTSRAWMRFPNEARPDLLSALVKASIQTSAHRPQILNLLAAHGADFNRPLTGYRSALSIPATDDLAGTLACILWSHGASTVGESSALFRAAEYGLQAAVPALLALGIDPRAGDDEIGTTLHRAAQEGYFTTIAALLENACLDIDAVDGEGNTALNLAVQMNPYSDEDDEEWEDDDDDDRASHVRAIEVLLCHGADSSICSRGTFDRAPLHWAVGMDTVGVVRTLLAHGADANVRTPSRQQTPAHMLAEDASISIGSLETMLAMLLAHGADLTCQDEDGVAPLDLLRASEAGQEWLQMNHTMRSTE